MNRARLVAFVIAGAAVFTAGSASAATVRVDPLLPLTKTRADTVKSTNWSGYAVESTSKFTDVIGTWVQPTATCNTSGSQYAAFWAGIDGYTSSSVEQLGTFANCSARKASYSAWYEMYPAASMSLSTSQYPVTPGDTLSAEVSVSGTNFTLSLLSSRGWHFSTTQSGSGLAQSSAELIAESPEICTLGIFCSIAKLTNFGTIGFSNVEAAVGGGADQPFSAFTTNSGPHEIIGTTSNGTVKMQPSALSASNNGFTVTWEHS